MYAVLNDELYHHGIKGQKWGVRRFQNPDGTRTTAGKKREKNRVTEGKPVGVKLDNGDILFVDSNELRKYGPDKTIQNTLARNKEAERKKNKTKLSDEERELEKELLRDDPDYARALKYIKKKGNYGGANLENTLDPKVLYENRDKLSDAELDKKLNRLRKENELRRMAEETNNNKKESKVPKFVIDAGKEILKDYLKKKGSKILDKVDINIMDKLKKTTDHIRLPNLKKEDPTHTNALEKINKLKKSK